MSDRDISQTPLLVVSHLILYCKYCRRQQFAPSQLPLKLVNKIETGVFPLVSISQVSASAMATSFHYLMVLVMVVAGTLSTVSNT